MGRSESVTISGVWTRTSDYEKQISSRMTMHMTKIEILVEVRHGETKEWRLIQTHHVPSIDQTISHITEVAGIEKAPKDTL